MSEKQRVIVVYGVRSLQEALELERAGASVIGVVLSDSPFGRQINVTTARMIARHLTTARLLVEAGEGRQLDVGLAAGIGAHWVQVSWGPEVSESWREDLTAHGLGWVLGRVPVDEDDDPSWVETRLIEYGEPWQSWSQIEICPDLEDGWPLLAKPSLEEVDVDDLAAMSARRRIVFSLPLPTGRIREVLRRLPQAFGFALNLGGAAEGVTGATHLTLDEALGTLQAFERADGG